jgi:uncharacterized protein YwqG
VRKTVPERNVSVLTSSSPARCEGPTSTGLPAPSSTGQTMNRYLGGAPYLESTADWPTHKARPEPFLGQFNFADLREHVPGIPPRGILAVYMNSGGSQGNLLTCRWFPEPQPDKTIAPPTSARYDAKYETQLAFTPSWSQPSSGTWQAIIGEKNEALWETVNDWQSDFASVLGENERAHQLFGHPSSALLEEVGVPELTRQRLVLRITFDNPAGFHWGSNVLYVLVDAEDLAAGRLDRTTSYLANV